MTGSGRVACRTATWSFRERLVATRHRATNRSLTQVVKENF